MEKDPDSLATVTVGSEKIPTTQSNYAPSEVYSTSEPPPAYMKPMKSSAVQIARIAGITLVTMSVILGSFILASSYVQARLSCTPESIAAMQAHVVSIQKHAEIISDRNHENLELFKRLHPEALVQNAIDPKESSQSTSESPIAKKEIPQTKDLKARKELDNGAKNDNENGDQDNEADDYVDEDFPPVHIKLPLQLDLDDIAGALIQQARNRVSCVVERRRSDEVMDPDNRIENATDSQRFQRLSGERVSILCEAGTPQKEQQQDQQQQQEITPIIIPLGTMQIPLNSQEIPNYNQYQLHTQYQTPEMHQYADSRVNQMQNVLPPELRNIPQLIMEMRPFRMAPNNQEQPMMQPQFSKVDVRQIPINLRHFPAEPQRNMRAPMHQMQQEPQIPMMYHSQQQDTQSAEMYNNREQSSGLLHPPPPPPEPEQRVDVPPQLMVSQPQQQEKPRSPFHGIPVGIAKMIQQVPLEIINILQHIDGAFPVPNIAKQRSENVQEFKPIPEGVRPIPLGPFPLPMVVRNLLEHGNPEGPRPQRPEVSEEQQQPPQQQEPKSFTGSDDQGDEIPPEVHRFIHQVFEGRAIPVPLRPAETMDVNVEARAEVADSENNEHQEQNQEQQPQEHSEMEQQKTREENEEANRPHYVQPRSIRSVPDFAADVAHLRSKRVRRCSCDCAC